MKNLLLLSIAATSATLSLTAPAIAAPPGWSDFKDSAGNVYVGATAPNGEIQIEMGNTSIKKSVKANQCGLAKIANSATSPIPSIVTVNGTPITVASQTQKILPKCLLANGSYQLEEARTGTFKTIDGSLILAGQTPNATVEYTATGTVSKRLRANACGWAKISNSTTSPIPASATIKATTGAVGFASPTAFSSVTTGTPWKCTNNTAFKPV
jgi:hypothetical protein